MRLQPLLLALAPAVLVPAATAHASPLAGVKVTSCQAGQQSSDRKATFVGHMRSVSGSSQLAMRFQLEERYGGRKFTKVQAPELRGLRKSRTGVQSYTYSQGVTSLVAGESYRVQVQFRWLDSAGKTVLQVKRYSGTCDEPGQLPNLQVLSATARPGVVVGTEAYTVNVLNAGLGPAGDVQLQLVIDGATPDTATLDTLAPGEVHAIHFTGPACKHRMRATVDPSDTVHESVESDNSLAGGCPPQG
ncbi:MAG: CARDB domain-containing protein [Thermoleophilaceae bacterium]|jgi:hypothetical protein